MTTLDESKIRDEPTDAPTVVTVISIATPL